MDWLRCLRVLWLSGCPLGVRMVCGALLDGRGIVGGVVALGGYGGSARIVRSSYTLAEICGETFGLPRPPVGRGGGLRAASSVLGFP